MDGCTYMYVRMKKKYIYQDVNGLFLGIEFVTGFIFLFWFSDFYMFSVMEHVLFV